MFASPAAVTRSRKGHPRRAMRIAAMCAAMAGAFAAATAAAAPSVYPTGVTRYDPVRAHNGYVLFHGSPPDTHSPPLDALSHDR